MSYKYPPSPLIEVIDPITKSRSFKFKPEFAHLEANIKRNLFIYDGMPSRDSVRGESDAALSSAHGIHRATIYAIRTRKTWKHVK